jgi:hypothetical protein
LKRRRMCTAGDASTRMHLLGNNYAVVDGVMYIPKWE